MRGKHNLKRGRRIYATRLVLMSVALTLAFCTVIGGTVAWLVTDTKPVVNTFTYGDINISLEETPTDDDGDPNTNSYPMVPGNSITKDPKVTFEAKSENAWLFVKLEKSGGCTITGADGNPITYSFDDYLTYEIILDDPATTDVVEGWTALEDVEGVYWMAVNKADTDAVFYVIKDNTVNVKGEVTKEMLNALDADGASYPTLTITAYAVQRDANIEALDTVAEAWNLASGN